jgi:hypothetical protein
MLDLREKKDDTLGLEVELDLEAAPATVYALGLRRCRGGTRSQAVRAHDELRFPCYL